MTNNRANPTTDGEDMVIAASASNQAAQILGHTNYWQVGYGLEAPLRRFQTHLYSGKSVEKWTLPQLFMHFKQNLVAHSLSETNNGGGKRDIDQPKPSTATRLWASDLQAQDPIKHFGVAKAC
ncbi:hypothetical protein B0H14DRAFT_2571005 [Mycena olivaceomarginata]|nr:hypothetical protein B0H14DRAFT_2571005 [Mycena olivaceomarginata]